MVATKPKMGKSKTDKVEPRHLGSTFLFHGSEVITTLGSDINLVFG